MTCRRKQFSEILVLLGLFVCLIVFLFVCLFFFVLFCFCFLFCFVLFLFFHFTVRRGLSHSTVLLTEIEMKFPDVRCYLDISLIINSKTPTGSRNRIKV